MSRPASIAIFSAAEPRTPSALTAAIRRRTSASHSARSASLVPKWWVTSAAVTPAAAAISRTDAANPRRAKHSIAASRSRDRPTGSPPSPTRETLHA
ncbi:hypothetical protein BJF78_01540 [Pseudonocardia sp. CNS-139]|nr:hypothetical protein BJF78_01540 [Pseudonocardia sp. CNS-139]